MNCACHGQPAYWQKDRRLKAGGWWECPVKRQAFNATRTTNETRRSRIVQQKRDRYDNDAIHRIEHNLRNDARARLKRLETRRAAHGALPD